MEEVVEINKEVEAVIIKEITTTPTIKRAKMEEVAVAIKEEMEEAGKDSKDSKDIKDNKDNKDSKDNKEVMEEMED